MNEEPNPKPNGKRRIGRNVLGGPLESCCRNPMTGFYRDGSCNTGTDDAGTRG